jgi:HEAT repeat protein/S1-C subfamily serine protease
MRSAKQLQPGANVRCPKCGLVFKFGEEAKAEPAEAPRPAPAKSAPPAPKPKPPAPKTSIASSRADDRPVAARRRSDDDYDDRDDDRPTRRKRRKSQQGGSGMAIIAVVGGLLLVVLLAGAGLVGYLVWGGSSKKDGPIKQVGSTEPLAPRPLPPNRPNGPAVTQTNTTPNTPTTPSKPDTTSNDNSLPPATTGGSGSVKDIYDYVLKSTTLIINVMQNGMAMGTGSVIDVNERLILTNFHVVANNAELVVFFPIYENGKPVAERDRYMTILKDRTKSPQDLLRAEVIATDTQRDLALIRVPKVPAGTETLPLAKGLVNIGQTVHSVGNPGASGALWVYTQGAVRSVYRKKWKAAGGELLLTLEAEIIETQSPTNHGDSGGPLVNDRGELVGVTEGGSTEGHLISTFISLNEARDFIEREYQHKFGKAWSPIARAPLRMRGGSGGGDITSLIASLDNKDAKARASAARALGELGPDAKLAISRLVKALKDPDDLTCRASAEALTKIGAPGRDDLPVLTEALKDLKPEVRRYAATAIGQIGPQAASAADQLVEALRDDDERVRESAVRSLGSLGGDAKTAAVPGLTKALQDRVKSVRVAAASALTNLMSPPAASDVPLLVTILKLPDPEASVFGARTLAKLGKQAKAALPDLMEAVKGGDPGVRRGALDTLSAIGPDAKTALPIYVAAMKDASDIGVRQAALHAIGELGPELSKDKNSLTKEGAAKDGIAKDAVNAVLEAIKDSDAQVKKAAFSAVARLGALVGAPGAKQVMPTVLDSLQSKDSTVRDQAYETIAGLGPLAKEAIPTLITMMEKQDVKLFKETKSSKIFLQDADDAFLDKIAKTIGKIGLPAVAPLRTSLRSTNQNFGLLIGVCRALGEVGPPAKASLRDLAAISNSSLPPPVCFEADRAIRKISTK